MKCKLIIGVALVGLSLSVLASAPNINHSSEEMDHSVSETCQGEISQLTTSY